MNFKPNASNGSSLNHDQSKGSPEAEPQHHRINGQEGRRMSLAASVRHSITSAFFHPNKSKREIYLGNMELNNRLYSKCSNKIITSKYTPTTILPLFLISQFTRSQNIFFLGIGILQLTYKYVPSSRLGTIVPLAIVITISFIKELLIEMKFWSDSKVANSQPVEFLDSANKKLCVKVCGDIQVGDIVKIKAGEFFPSDLILISSNEKDGSCYTETSNIDGEINLKVRRSSWLTAKYNTVEGLLALEGKVIVEAPNKSLNSLDGNIFVDHDVDSLSMTNLLLRGAKLENTSWIFGLVIYTGKETKVSLNYTKPKLKRTELDQKMNMQTFLILLILLIMTLGSSAAYSYFLNYAPFYKNILYGERKGVMNAILEAIPLFILLYNNLVPLSLMVTCEILKAILSVRIRRDYNMFYKPANRFVMVRSPNLIEDLGLINNVFCDKTGTLTCNQINLRALCSAGKIYSSNLAVQDFEVCEQCNSFLKEDKSGLEKETAITILLCNQAFTMLDSESNKMRYITPSIDEEALLVASNCYNIGLEQKSETFAIIKDKDGSSRYDILETLDFTSDRKCMSVIVRCPDGKIKIYIKGSDEVIFGKLCEASSKSELCSKTKKKLDEFTTRGYRVLCLAYKEIAKEEYKSWKKSNDESRNPVSATVFEEGLNILGFSACEDKLQDRVSETISKFSNAGIKTWILTGDGRNAVLNIAASCSFITPKMPVFECTSPDPEEILKYFKESLIKINGFSSPDDDEGSPSRFRRMRKAIDSRIIALCKSTRKKFQRISHSAFGNDNAVTPDDSVHLVYKYGKKTFRQQKNVALIITGLVLEAVMKNEHLSKLFLELAMSSSSVICCRMSPLQKSQVVSLVKNNVKNAVVLSIGDGANDIGMIRAAHIGVGINGIEGTQASNSADFSIYKFCHLENLMLIHGSRIYYSVCSFVLYSFYKNNVLYFTQLLYAFYSQFSGTSLYESWSTLASYNVIWVFVQPFAIGIFGCAFETRLIEVFPELYKLGQNREFYNNKRFFGMLMNSVITSTSVFLLWVCIFKGSKSILGSDGSSLNRWYMGAMIFMTVLVIVSIECIFYVSRITVAIFIISALPILIFIQLYMFYSKNAPRIGVSTELLGTSNIFAFPALWLGLILCVGIKISADLMMKYIRREFYTKTYHLAQEVVGMKNNPYNDTCTGLHSIDFVF